MKTTSTKYFPLLFVFCILFSLLTVAIQNIYYAESQSSYTFDNTVLKSHKHEPLVNDFLFEETESESETKTSFESKLQSALLTQLLIFIEEGINIPKTSTTASLRDQNANPIYLKVCSFRI